MPQNRESGARANEYGRETARKIANKIGAVSTSKTSNEFKLGSKKITIRCARNTTNDIGMTYSMLKRADSIIAALEQDNGEYELYAISPEKFQENMRETRSKGAVAGKVGLVRKSVFLNEGKFIRKVKIGILPANKKPILSSEKKLTIPQIKKIGDGILNHINFILDVTAKDDADFRFKLNRWVYSRLQQAEIRTKRPIKKQLWDLGMKSCQECHGKFDTLKNVEIHRKDTSKGYSVKNCILVCRKCHQKHKNAA